MAEEQEHARLLELVLVELGVPLRSHHWTDWVFVLVRRAHSLRSEILVLMVAEVIALTYYFTQFVVRVWRDRRRVSARLFPPSRGPSRTSGGRRARR